MKIKDVEIHHEFFRSERCSWSGCRRKAQHHAVFRLMSSKGWIGRLMDLCNEHRGLFKRKYLMVLNVAE